jgi:lipopolysaccharide heptosyltransferase I
MKILVIKPSSFGDIIHAFAAISDLKKNNPSFEVDWYVDEQYKDIPHWNRYVDGVFSINRKRFRKLNKFSFGLAAHRLIKKLKRRQYDVVVDLYFGLQDASLLARLGVPVIGPSRAALSGMAQDKRLSNIYSRDVELDVSNTLVDVHRQLMSKTFGYEYTPLNVDYGVKHESVCEERKLDESIPYLIFVHATSGKVKNWPEPYWQTLLKMAGQSGYQVLLPWGDESERKRAQRVAAEYPEKARVLDKMSLGDLACLIATSKGVVGGDTGLTHIASALGVPTIRLFGATSAQAAIPAANGIDISSDLECAPCMNRNNCEREDIGQFSVFPPCFEMLTPYKVWDELMSIANSCKE